MEKKIQVKKEKEVMKRKNYFEFTIKPLPFAMLIYLAGWYDFKHGIFGREVTVGFFFMTVSVWIIISYLIRYRSKTKNSCDSCKFNRKLAGIFLIFLPFYTLIYWFVSIYGPFQLKF